MFADVIPARRMPRELSMLTYSLNDSSQKNSVVGQLVSIPFGKTFILGIIDRIYSDAPSYSIKNIKPVADIVHTEPVLSIKQLSFLKEISVLYRTSLGFLIKCALFSLQKKFLKQFVSSSFSTKEFAQTSVFAPKLFTYTTLQNFITFLNKIPFKAQRLIIVPDLLAIKTIYAQLGNQKNICIVNSALSNQTLFTIWMKLWNNEPITIIGTRRAFFLPWKNLQQIIVYEEANPLHKNWDMAPRIHNRDTAKTLALHHGAELYITGHTPSLESYFAAKKSFLPISSLLKQKQTILFINTDDQKKQKNYNLLSEPLKEYLVSRFEKKDEYIVFFCQRRGNSSIVTCTICERIYTCPSCQNFLTFHQKLKILSCHLCHFYEPFPTPCLMCDGLETRLLKNGTEALEEELKSLAIPNFTINRLDKDTKKTIFQEHNTSQIIIGTQQAWNLIQWEKVTLFAFIDIDTVLQLPEYKTNETVWFAIRDALFRLKKGQIYIQTADPNHMLFKSIFTPNAYYTEELAQRKEFFYPPFSYLVKLYTSYSTKEEAEKAAEQLHAKLYTLTKKKFPHIILSYPRAAIPELYQKKIWYVIVVKLPTFSYRSILSELLSLVPSNWKIDLNPQSLLRFT